MKTKTILNDLKKEPLFYLGLILKLGALPFFGSYYLRDLFIPFFDQAILHVGTNPWSLMPPIYFPYGSTMFLILFIPRYLAYLVFGSLALGTGPLGLFLAKAPLLIIDGLLLITLLKFNPRRLNILIYYWLNPVLFYITYVHGQLDIASTTFCLMSLVYLTQNNIRTSAFWMAMATLCKFHVVFIIPLMMVYLWNNNFLKQALKQMALWGGIWAIIVGIGLLPVLLAKQVAYVTVSSPQALRVFGLQLPLSPERVFFVGAAFLLLILGRLCVSTRISRHGLVFGSGILFGLLVFMTDAGPGWYFWVFPFLALFYAKYFNNQPLIFFGLNGFYLLNFCVIDPTGLGLTFAGSSVLYTVVQSFLFGCLIDMWVTVIRIEMPAMGRIKPLVIGIAGDSGVGKNTLAVSLEKLFGSANTVSLEGDDYHRWARGTEKWDFYTHLNPRANELPTLVSHANQLIEGLEVHHHRYDHGTGQFTAPREIRPGRALIIQGLHTLYRRDIRRGLDIRIFLAPDELVRMSWKLTRDLEERGTPVEKVLESEDKRRSDALTHINPQRNHADWVIEFFPLENITQADVIGRKKFDVGVRHVVFNDAPVMELIDVLKTQGGCEVTWKEDADDLDRVIIQVVGHPDRSKIEEMAKILFPNLRQVTRCRRPPVWDEGLKGVNQLFALSLIRRPEWRPSDAVDQASR